jgi:hypothetical protein
MNIYVKVTITFLLVSFLAGWLKKNANCKFSS